MMAKILVVGLGKSGAAACELLEKEGNDVVGVDDNPEIVKQWVHAGKRATIAPDVTQFDRLVLSPGVPLTNRVIVAAANLGIPLIGEAELALQRLAIPAIGITGTNGKTTVTLLITHVLKAAGLAAHALGNVGEPLSSYVTQAKKDDIAVVELSSFQLDTLMVAAFDIGVILNITPDHLDRYESMQSYAESKCHLQHCLKPGGELWVHESVVSEFQALLKVDYKIFGQNLDCALSINRVASLRNLGAHDLTNLLAAWVVCRKFGVTEDVFLQAASHFKKPSHRIEWVASIDGIDYVDDSKGTNVDATMKAVQAMSRPVCLIVGGVDKGASYEVWKRAFQGKVRQVVAIGLAAEQITRDLAPEYLVVTAPTLAGAVHCSRLKALPGDVILLSPGCSSYDMFRDYAHRGDEFKRIVYLLQEKKG
jgi:UDP-N-acetylmuramoylalanine--D-glutamate ligase